MPSRDMPILPSQQPLNSISRRGALRGSLSIGLADILWWQDGWSKAIV